jgi:hypothetical protein
MESLAGYRILRCGAGLSAGLSITIAYQVRRESPPVQLADEADLWAAMNVRNLLNTHPASVAFHVNRAEMADGMQGWSLFCVRIRYPVNLAAGWRVDA